MPDAAREFNIFLPQICGGQCGPRSLQSTPRLQTAYGLVCGRNTRRGNAIVFSIRRVVVSSRRRLLLGKIEEVLEEVTEGANAERDRMVFWIYYRQGLTASAIAAIPALKLTQKGIESLLSRVTNSLRKQLLIKKKIRQIPSKASVESMRLTIHTDDKMVDATERASSSS